MHRVLEGIIRNKRIASAYMFVGPPTLEKMESASAFAQRLGCKKFDLVELKPDGTSIKIEQIRELRQRVRFGPSGGEYLFVIIDRADNLTPEAAAAFLKTLEEPSPGVVFVLLVEREDRLPVTIASRCQKIIFGEEIKAWQPSPEWGAFRSEVNKAKNKSVLELLEWSSRFEKEKEKIEELLYELAFYSKNELEKIGVVRVLLDAVKKLKKKANLKLTLDVMCLKLGEA